MPWILLNTVFKILYLKKKIAKSEQCLLHGLHFSSPRIIMLFKASQPRNHEQLNINLTVETRSYIEYSYMCMNIASNKKILQVDTAHVLLQIYLRY